MMDAEQSKLCLDNCSTKMYADILSSFFNEDPNVRKRVTAATLPEREHSPLVVINTALQEKNIDDVLSKLASMP